jgi:hypothetical protein
MTLRFAAARSPECSPVARALIRRAPGVAINDNGGPVDEAILNAALRHFAAHGLGAARVAANEAEQNLADGNHRQYERWLAVCRMLDRRLANRLARRHAAKPG